MILGEMLTNNHNGYCHLMKNTVISYAKAGFCVAVCVICSAYISHRLNLAKPLFLSEEFVCWIRVVTTALFATATLGRCGWGIQTWSGKSPAEMWNLWFFRVVYLCGLELLLIAFLVRPVVVNS
jgi:hypothetical protein